MILVDITVRSINLPFFQPVARKRGFNSVSTRHPYEGQENRANALTILSAVIIVWNARGLSYITDTLAKMGEIPDPDLLRHISPAG